MSKNLSDLREALFDTLQKVKNGEIDLDRARAVNEIGKTLIDSAKVEVEYLRLTDDAESSFIDPKAAAEVEPLPNGVAGVVRHLIR